MTDPLSRVSICYGPASMAERGGARQGRAGRAGGQQAGQTQSTAESPERLTLRILRQVVLASMRVIL